MRVALIIVILVGIGIGFLLPVPAARPPAAPKPAESAPLDPPRETVIERRNGHFVAVADVNGMPTRFVVDTGADTVALTTEDAKRANIPFDPNSFTEIGQGASGPVRGQEVRIANITLDGKSADDIRAVVLENSQISLLGHTYLRKLAKVSIEGDEMRLR